MSIEFYLYNYSILVVPYLVLIALVHVDVGIADIATPSRNTHVHVNCACTVAENVRIDIRLLGQRSHGYTIGGALHQLLHYNNNNYALLLYMRTQPHSQEEKKFHVFLLNCYDGHARKLICEV